MTVFYNNYFIVFSDITSLLKKTPNEEELLLLLEDISDKWYDIGLSLQVHRNVLDDLNQSEDNSETKLDKVINILKNTKSSSNNWEIDYCYWKVLLLITRRLQLRYSVILNLVSYYYYIMLFSKYNLLF